MVAVWRRNLFNARSCTFRGYAYRFTTTALAFVLTVGSLAFSYGSTRTANSRLFSRLAPPPTFLHAFIHRHLLQFYLLPHRALRRILRCVCCTVLPVRDTPWFAHHRSYLPRTAYTPIIGSVHLFAISHICPVWPLLPIPAHILTHPPAVLHTTPARYQRVRGAGPADNLSGLVPEHLSLPPTYPPLMRSPRGYLNILRSHWFVYTRILVDTGLNTVCTLGH